MSYKIYRQTDEQIVLQDTGEIFMPLIVVLVDSCLFFPVFKRNRLTIDAIRKEAVKTKPIKERLRGKGKVVSKCYYIIHRANTSIIAPVLRKE
ncbi:hypothetical protein K0I63_03275 [Shewanella rhizosphaerae]|uniref:hypothetical protein n=1 Tax=Shewanella rhizosphaerae TaxID=2864207 RepID=UPI001C65F4F4|nr:hypothetical protein [Shewanella rhizosphaerae]QYK13551.1 hypothetical protein K0I63_03275 [Shewanella rhizosphaerae]